MKSYILALALCAYAFTACGQDLPKVNRVWTFKQGGKVEGAFVKVSGTNVIVKRADDGKDYALPSLSLSEDDLAWLKENAKREAQAEVMKKQGLKEINCQMLKLYPEKVVSEKCWMDTEFDGINNWADRPSVQISFGVSDSNSSYFSRCIVSKEHGLDAQILKLHKGDHIRLTGVVHGLPPNSDTTFYVDSIKVIQ